LRLFHENQECRKSGERDLRYILGPLDRGALEFPRDLPLPPAGRVETNSILPSLGFSPACGRQAPFAGF
jgi:hypothetical protein